MMKKSIAFLLIAVAFLLITCKDDDASVPGVVEIRVKNTSSFDYSEVYVDTNGGDSNYGDISAQNASGYRSFDFAYRYAFVSLKIDGETFVLQPTDYVGENKLVSGRYTYAIGASAEGDYYGRLTLTLIKD